MSGGSLARSHVGGPPHVHVGQVLEPRGLADEHVDLPLDGERQHVLVRDALAPVGVELNSTLNIGN